MKTLQQHAADQMIKALTAERPQTGLLFNRCSGEINLYNIVTSCGIRGVAYNANESILKEFEALAKLVHTTIEAGGMRFVFIMKSK